MIGRMTGSEDRTQGRAFDRDFVIVGKLRELDAGGIVGTGVACRHLQGGGRKLLLHPGGGERGKARSDIAHISMWVASGISEAQSQKVSWAEPACG